MSHRIPFELRSFYWDHTFSGLGGRFHGFCRREWFGGEIEVRWLGDCPYRISVTWGDGRTEWYRTFKEVRQRLQDAGLD